MNTVLNFLTRTEVLVVILLLAILIIAFLVTRRLNRKRLVRKLHDLEIEINSVRSTPLTYKLNKAVGLTKVNENVVDRVNKAQSEFVEVNNGFEQLTHLLGNAEDDILTGKTKSGKAVLEEIETVFGMTSVRALKLDKELDHLLEDEIRLRDDINTMKNEFRNVKLEYENKQNQLSLAQDELDNEIQEIELLFNSFEEWMFASEFEHAQVVYVEIRDEIANFRKYLFHLPAIIEKARGIVPHLMEQTKTINNEVLSKGVYLQHLEVQKNLDLVNSQLNEDVTNIKQLNLDGILERLDESTKRLQQLITQISKEDKAFDSVMGLKVSTLSQQQQVSAELSNLINGLPGLRERYGFTDLFDKVPALQEADRQVSMNAHRLNEKLLTEKIPYSTLLIEFNEFAQDVNHLQAEIQAANKLIHTARQDEQRANNQLLKLSLLLNDIQTKIDARHLPHISNTYQGDVSKAYQRLNQIKMILAVNPLNINLLNSSVNESIEFIYKLYNNVNNLIGSVDMIENAIVFANKYRSSSAELDSELTRAEISFRNGEYTFALKTVIYAIEKFKPGTPYEELIIQNAKSA